MADSIVDDVASVFSILPSDQAVEAQREVLANYLRRTPSAGATIKWAEFGRGGEFIRGGATRMPDLSSRLFLPPVTDPDIAAVTARAAGGEVSVGAIEFIKGRPGLFWFVPSTGGSSGAYFTAICIGEDLVGTVLGLFNADVSLTRAERRVAFQVTGGMNPRSAAEQDGVSPETKRAQLKSVCGKLNCSGQIDLVRKLIGQMTHLLHLIEVDNTEGQVIEGFARRRLGGAARLTVHRLSNGRLIHYFEVGPEDGAPLLVLHGMLYPFMLLNAGPSLDANGLRLVMPVRPGYLAEPSSPGLFTDDGLVQQGMEDWGLLIQEVLGGRVSVAGHSIGAILAMRLAERFPHLVDRLICIAAHFPDEQPTSSAFMEGFFGGLKKLANEPGIFRYLTWQFRKYYADINTVRPILRRMFEACPRDVATLEGEIGAGPAYAWFVESYRNSIVGISEDFRWAMKPWTGIYAGLSKPIHFVHGELDPIIGPDRLRDIAKKNPRADVRVITGGGHLIAASDPEAVWTHVAKMLRAEAAGIGKP